MKQTSFLVGVVVGLLLGPGILYMYVAFGRVPVSSFDPELPFETTLASEAVRIRIAREMPKSAPIPLTEGNLIAGAQTYRKICAMCHGLPGENPPAIAAGMYPPPPQFFHGKGVTENPVGETYWKVANGLRLTGMPGFREMLSPDQVWQVTLLLSQTDKLPAGASDILTPKDASQKFERGASPAGSPLSTIWHDKHPLKTFRQPTTGLRREPSSTYLQVFRSPPRLSHVVENALHSHFEKAGVGSSTSSLTTELSRSVCALFVLCLRA